MRRKIYNKGVWPEDFTRVIMILLQNKSIAEKCEDPITISMMSHATKILLTGLTKNGVKGTPVYREGPVWI
jgi:hypothetical protein